MPRMLREITNTFADNANKKSSTKLEHFVIEMDVDDSDPQEVKEYENDIYKRLHIQVEQYRPQADYMDRQRNINSKMRTVLVDWIIEVHCKCKLQLETLFLSVNIIDRFLQRQQVARKRFQLVGVTALMIAAKFEEIYPPEVAEFVDLTDNAYTTDEVHDTELTILNLLDFRLCGPTVAHFFERYQRLIKCKEMQYYLIQYMLELTLLDVKMLKYSPVELAASACLLSRKLLEVKPSWPMAMVRHTQLHERNMSGCIMDLATLLRDRGSVEQQFVDKKFSLAKFHNVAQLAF